MSRTIHETRRAVQPVSLAAEHTEIDDSAAGFTTSADPDAALALTRQALDRYRRSDAAADNLGYHEVVRYRAALHAGSGNAGAARDELETLHHDLGARGVNGPVLDDIQATAQALE